MALFRLKLLFSITRKFLPTFPLSSLSDLGVLRVLELILVDGAVREK